MKATISSIGFLTNWRTRLVHFFFLPMVNMFLMVAINQDFFHSLFWSTAAASILMSGSLLVISGMAISFTTDRNLGIDREIVSTGRFSFYYWEWKIAVSAGCALLLILINLLLLLFGGRTVPFTSALSLVPQMLFSGVAGGFIAIILSWGTAIRTGFLILLPPSVMSYRERWLPSVPIRQVCAFRDRSSHLPIRWERSTVPTLPSGMIRFFLYYGWF